MAFVGLGAYPATVPHTRPIRLSITAGTEELAGRWPFLRGPEDALRLLREWQVEATGLFERTGNVLKLVGDQYLARMYRVASERFHLPQWDAAIERKLKVLDGIYEKLASRAASRRFEVLEVVIIVLIAVSSLTPFLPLVTD